MLKIGMSSCAFALNEESFRNIAEKDIKNIEISMAYAKYPEIDYAEVKRLADAYGVKLWSYHLPFGGVNVLDIASRDENMRRRSVEYWSELIRKGANIGIDKFVAHPSSEPKSEDPETREQEIEQSQRSLATLAEVAGENGAVIAVEDLPRSCLGRTSEELLRLVSADPRLGICFDTNHLLAEDLYDFADRIAHKIVTVHISDYDFVNERHWLPGEGKIDWQRLYNKLIANGYKGVWMYEIGLRCPKTIIRDRALTPEDFARNAREIFEDRELTVIGRQKENLGMWE